MEKCWFPVVEEGNFQVFISKSYQLDILYSLVFDRLCNIILTNLLKLKQIFSTHSIVANLEYFLLP